VGRRRARDGAVLTVRAPTSRAALALLLAWLAACAGAPDGDPEDWLHRIAGRGETPAGRHWPVSPERLERLLQSGKGSVRDRTPISSGVTGADRLTLYFPAIGRSVRVKWKAAPPGDADGWNNSPRKELAAYELQKWFLPPSAYVVPTTAARCIALEDYRRLDSSAEPTLPGTRCVFGVQALWLANVEVPEPLFDEARFRNDARYARHLANFNLFAYLIQDRDTREGNVLTAKDPRNRRVFSVDNGISFDGRLYNVFENEWQELLVPALPRASIERLRRVTRERAGELATVAQFRVDGEGLLRPEPPGPPLDPEQGSRWQGGVLQLGLTEAEIEKVWQRLQELLRRVDEQAIALF
jgi:hypothetical protein